MLLAAPCFFEGESYKSEEGRGVTDRGVTALKVLRGFERLGGRFGYFLFFFPLREGYGGGSEAAPGGGGDPFFIENPRRRGVFSRRGRMAGTVSAANWEIWGGGLNIFFFGAETSTKEVFRGFQRF